MEEYLNNNKNGKLISINVLEYISIIINYCAALMAFLTSGPTDDPFPVLLNLADSISAIRWTNHCCKVSLAGRALSRLFCMLLVNSPLGINIKWLSTIENVIADKISRLRLSNESGYYDYSKLKQEFPELANCRNFQPNPKLLSMIYPCVC